MKAPVWKSPGLPGHHPHRSRLTFLSYTHRPMRSGPHGPGGRWASGRFPKNPLLVCFAKNRLTSSKNQPGTPAFSDLVKKKKKKFFSDFRPSSPKNPPAHATGPATRCKCESAPAGRAARTAHPLWAPAAPAVATHHTGTRCPAFASGLPLPHIPTDRCAAARTGGGADGPAADSRKTYFWRVPLKIDSRAAKINPELPPFWTLSKFIFLTFGKPGRGAAYSGVGGSQKPL